MRTHVPAMMFLATLSGAALLANGPSVASPIPKHLMKDGNADQAKLQGKWKLTSLRIAGRDVGGDIAKTMNMTIEVRDDSFTSTTNQGRVIAKVKLDSVDGVKRFATVNTQKWSADGKHLGGEDDVSLGYLIEGDKLTWAMVPGANGKATMADPGKPAANAILMVFTRVKKE
jgi:uncharacterized protein (TIGR03067 family)